MSHRLRCAVYTRKSSEEGLDQAFNSLDAQRQAGLDYIASQRHEGWSAITTRYDDGGRSGGTMDRPALKALLDDVSRGRIDVVVVYKVDRLSRSLADFARIMQLFEQHNVSFVSVTQQFSTTTSMGRLTLNMLLSFAQFEREVAGERIRDKIAATVRQGYWVCGRPPFGYRVQRDDEPRGLYVIPQQADAVRRVFDAYAASGSLLAVARAVSEDFRAAGRARPTPKMIHRILTNSVYIGKVTHTDRDGVTRAFDGRHQAIIDDNRWRMVQDAMEATSARRSMAMKPKPHWLKGKLRTADGFAMSPSTVRRQASKLPESSGAPRHVRYYTSQKAIKHGFAECRIKTVNAQHLEGLVDAMVLDYIIPGPRRNAIQIDDARAAIHDVTVAEDEIVVRLDEVALSNFGAPHPSGHPEPSRSRCLYTPRVRHADGHVVLTLPIALKRIDGRRRIVSPDGQDLFRTTDQQGQPRPKPVLVDAVAKAHRFRRALDGSTVHEVAAAEACAESHIKKLVPLAYLAPAITKSILNGTASSQLTIDDLVAAARHLDWRRQAEALGIPLQA